MEGEEIMSSRESILNALRENAKKLPAGNEKERNPYAMPDWSELHPTAYDNAEEEFKTKTQTVAGAKLIVLSDGDNVNDVIRKAYPEAKIFASHLEGIDADLNPDTVEDVTDLMKADVGVVEGRFGVAENGCIWIPQTMKEKAVCFASEYLVIMLRRDAIVSNMHEAYGRIESDAESFGKHKFGTFISGPSKTADIESALVYGAQAARGVTVILI